MHVCAAGLAWECRSGPGVAVFGTVTVAPKSDGRNAFINVGLARGASVAGDGVEVLGEGNLGVVNLLVIGLERGRVDLGVVIAVYVVQSWRPVDGQIVRIFSGGTSLLQLLCRRQIFGDGIGAVKRVHVRNVLSGEHKRVDILAHERLVFDVREGCYGSSPRYSGVDDTHIGLVTSWPRVGAEQRTISGFLGIAERQDLLYNQVGNLAAISTNEKMQSSAPDQPVSYRTNAVKGHRVVSGVVVFNLDH